MFEEKLHMYHNCRVVAFNKRNSAGKHSIVNNRSMCIYPAVRKQGWNVSPTHLFIFTKIVNACRSRAYICQNDYKILKRAQTLKEYSPMSKSICFRFM